MVDRTLQLVLHYDGARFCGWQRQPTDRTVQGELERVFTQLIGSPVPVTGAGRTDAGVHARGQAAHVTVPPKWTPAIARRALNALLPDDVWVAAVHEMDPRFHARFSATARAYSYHVGTTEEAQSPFRRRFEWYVPMPLAPQLLHETAQIIMGEHAFRGFAVRGTAPDTDHHRCIVRSARWTPREHGGGWIFTIEANRFLHHMVRFMVGTTIDVASGRRSLDSFRELLAADDNLAVSPPAPAHALFLDRVTYPSDLYVSPLL